MKNTMFLTVFFLGLACGERTSDHGRPTASTDRANSSELSASPEIEEGGVFGPGRRETQTQDLNFVGKATVALQDETDSNNEGELVLVLDEKGTVDGRLSMEGVSHAVTGTMNEDVLRCWLFHGTGDPETVRRGVLIGEVKGDHMKGTWTVSGNGGSDILRGFWSVVSQ